MTNLVRSNAFGVALTASEKRKLHTMRTVIKAASSRLGASEPRENAVSKLVREVESVTNKYKIQRINKNYPNPREYRKPAPPPMLKEVQRDFEKLGFKFKHLPIHSMSTEAVESEGRYQSGEYILDLVLNHDMMEVNLYY
jgi:hypothetical protein